MRSPKEGRQRQPRRRGFDDDNFFGNTPSPPTFPGFGGSLPAPELKATVKWFNPEKGFGFVELADGTGDVFLHVNALQAAGHTVVGPGMKLAVRVGQGQKGRQVEQVMSVDTTTGEAPAPSSRQDSGAPRPARSARPQLDLSNAVEMDGTVKWYNPDKGFGFITPKEGGKDVFVHATALERAGISPLAENQAVRMTVVQGSKGAEVGAISLI